MRLVLLLLAGWLLFAKNSADVRLLKWDRGIALQSRSQPDIAMYLWFYEWNMFDAMSPGEHTPGSHKFPIEADQDGSKAAITSPAIRLTAQARPGGADLLLEVTNLSGHDWPELAGIIPCWSPGRLETAARQTAAGLFHEPRTRQFGDPDRNRTFFLSPGGLAVLSSRAIHFNSALREKIDAASDHGQFVFSYKWPASDVNARAGVLIRESSDHEWVTGIGWTDFLSVQGHNPWNCMHVCVRLGPLRQKESKTVRGRLYLFRGSRQDCLARFREDLGIPK